jgi:hypothetical protein
MKGLKKYTEEKFYTGCINVPQYITKLQDYENRLKNHYIEENPYNYFDNDSYSS